MMYAMSKTCKRLTVSQCLELQETPSKWHEGDSRPNRKRRKTYELIFHQRVNQKPSQLMKKSSNSLVTRVMRMEATV